MELSDTFLLSSFELSLKIFFYSACQDVWVHASGSPIPHPPPNIRTHFMNDTTCLKVDLFYELRVLGMLT